MRSNGTASHRCDSLLASENDSDGSGAHNDVSDNNNDE